VEGDVPPARLDPLEPRVRPDPVERGEPEDAPIRRQRLQPLEQCERTVRLADRDQPLGDLRLIVAGAVGRDDGTGGGGVALRDERGGEARSGGGAEERCGEPQPGLRVRPDLYDEDYTSDEYEQMLSMYEGTMSQIVEGEIVKSKVLRITESAVILDVGFKSEGLIPIEEFIDESGQVVEQRIEDRFDIYSLGFSYRMGELWTATVQGNYLDRESNFSPFTKDRLFVSFGISTAITP